VAAPTVDGIAPSDTLSGFRVGKKGKGNAKGGDYAPNAD
jgi:hypothetical protein